MHPSPRLVLTPLIALASLAGAASAQDFGRLHGLIPSGWNPTAPVTGDLDQDGDLDVLYAQANTLRGLINDGSARFTVRDLSLPNLTANKISFAELTGDGVPDILTQSVNGLRLFAGQGAGVFTELIGIFPVTSGHRDHELGDADGDGDLDLLLTLGNFSGPADRLILNDGGGAFSLGVFNLPGLAHGQAVFIDVEGDGDLDIATNHPRRFLRNDGTGHYTLDGSVVLPAMNGFGMLAFDFDEDGDQDILHGSDYFGFAENDGAGNFTVSYTGINNILTWQLIDWNGFGKMDLLTRPPVNYVTEKSTGLRIYRHAADGTLPRANVPTLENAPTEFWQYLSGDFDGDGAVDIIGDTGRDGLFRNRGEGSYELTLTAPEQFETNYDDVFLGDLDGDGFLDALGIIRGIYGQQQSSWLRNDGLGTFEAPVPLTGYWTIEHGLLDYDGDGDLDVLTLREKSTPISLTENLGGAVWAASTALPALPNLLDPETADVNVGDLNGDGADDVLLMVEKRFSDLNDYILLSDGAGGLTIASSSSQILPRSHLADLADIDGDGDLDAMILTDNTFRFFRNPGGGLLQSTGKILSRSGTDLDLDLADIDGDGAVDLLVTFAQGQRYVDLFLGNGDGSFQVPAAVSLLRPNSVYGPGEPHAFDADLDGDLDIYVSDGHYFENEGGLIFTDKSADLPIQGNPLNQLKGIAVGDLDRDGDLDVWAGGEGEIHWNLHRQLAWRTWPKVGDSLTFDLNGPPGGFYDLWYSQTAVTFPLAFGLLRIDITSAFRARFGIFDAAGRASAALEVPPDNSLIGTAVYWQSAFGLPLELSNLETTILH